MPTDNIQQIIELFDAVSEQPPEQRAALLEAACQGDVELRAEVERLIQAHDHADGFLEQLPLLAAESFDQRAHRARAIGRRIGPYRMLREIGHSGMGAVYLAVRDDDAFEKQVAIKLVWPGWNRDEMLRRFLQERRILARLEHPHIARLPVRFGTRTVAFSPDGKMLATGGENGSGEIQLWDVATGQQTGTLSGHTDALWSVKYSPDGSLIATAGQDRIIRLWNVKTQREIRRLSGHTDEIFSISFSPDGRRLATGSNDKTVRLWDVQTGAELLRLNGHTEQVWSVAFSADGSTLVSGSWDGTARVWRAATEAEVRANQGR